MKHAIEVRRAVELEAMKIETKTQQYTSKTLWFQHHCSRYAFERDTNSSTTDNNSNTIFLCLSLTPFIQFCFSLTLASQVVMLQLRFLLNFSTNYIKIGNNPIYSNFFILFFIILSILTHIWGEERRS